MSFCVLFRTDVLDVELFIKLMKLPMTEWRAVKLHAILVLIHIHTHCPTLPII